jgi:hypothetical protein
MWRDEVVAMDIDCDERPRSTASLSRALKSKSRAL